MHQKQTLANVISINTSSAVSFTSIPLPASTD